MMNKYSNFLAVTKASISKLQKDRDIVQKAICSKSTLVNNLEESRDLMNSVGVICQENMKNVVEELVSQALEAVFGVGHWFEMESKVVRNQPEIYMYMVRDGQRFGLKEELGGGVVDLVSFILRIVLWSVSSPRSASIMILDEPGKFISKDLQESFGEIISELSKMLGIQFILISHEEELIKTANISYSVVLSKGISTVERLDE